MHPPTASFVRPTRVTSDYDGEFDAVVSLCQGAFGLPAGTGDDDAVLVGMASALRPVATGDDVPSPRTFAVRHLEEGETFDADAGVNHEHAPPCATTAGETRDADLWTACFTPRELRLAVARTGLDVVYLWSVTARRLLGVAADRRQARSSS